MFAGNWRADKKMAGEEQDPLKKMKADIIMRAERTVLEGFPAKVAELHELLESDVFSCKNLETLKTSWSDSVPDPEPVFNGPQGSDIEEPTAKKRKLATKTEPQVMPSFPFKVNPPVVVGPMKANPRIVAMADRLKPELVAMADKLNLVKVWITVSIPKIEDGNNFGVSIQEDVLSEVAKSEGDVISYLDQINRYYMSRGKLVSKIAKYPFLEDYRRAVDEYDEKVFHSFRLILREVANVYFCLNDVILKNLEKIRQPRSSNTGAMY